MEKKFSIATPIFIFAVILVLVTGVTYFLSQTRFVTLVADMDTERNVQISHMLTNEGIRNRLVHYDRRVEVDVRNLEHARTVLVEHELNQWGGPSPFNWVDAFDMSDSVTDTTTPYTTLVANRDPMEIIPMSYALTNEGISNRVTQDSRALEVETERLHDARVLLITQELRPQDDMFTWADAFDASQRVNMAEEQRLVMTILAVETEIEKQLVQIRGVQSANVTLNIPEPSRVFRPDIPPASAAVTLTTTRSFDRVEGRNLAKILTNSVAGLELENVQIIDQHAVTIFSENMWMFDSPILNEEMARQQHEMTMQLAVTRMLRSIYHDVNVTVHLQFEESLFVERRIQTSGPGWVNIENSSVAVTATLLTDIRKSEWMTADHTRTNDDWQNFVNENAYPTLITDYTENDNLHALIESATGIPRHRNTVTIFEVINFID